MSYVCGYCDDDFSDNVMCPECVTSLRAEVERLKALLVRWLGFCECAADEMDAEIHNHTRAALDASTPAPCPIPRGQPGHPHDCEHNPAGRRLAASTPAPRTFTEEQVRELMASAWCRGRTSHDGSSRSHLPPGTQCAAEVEALLKEKP